MTIRQTVITPGDAGDVVLLRISDAPLGEEPAPFQITILANVRPLEVPTLIHLQREAMKQAQDALTPILRDLAAELSQAGYGTEPRPARQNR